MSDTEDITFDDCELHPDDILDQKRIDQINIFMQYYKQAHGEQYDINLFKNIEDPADTNKCMELLFEHMEIYNQNPDNTDIFDPIGVDFSDYADLYMLIIDDDQELTSETLWSLIIFLSEKDWLNINWQIIKIS